MDLNDVCMCGKMVKLEIIWQSEEKSFYKGYLEVLRNDNISKDSIPLIISGDLLKEIDVNSNVFVKGQIRSKDSIENDRLKVSLYLYVKEIENLLNFQSEFKNYVKLDGYVVKRPNLRTTPSGKQITDLLIACNYGKDKTAYIPAIAWGRNARFSSKLKIGDYTHVQGKFQSREYTKIIDSVPHNRVAYELSIDKIE